MSDLAIITAQALRNHYEEKYPELMEFIQLSLEEGYDRDWLIEVIGFGKKYKPDQLNNLIQVIDLMAKEAEGG